MGIPIVIATNGYGTPITEAANGYGTPVEVATNGYGIPVVIVASGGMPVIGSGGGGTSYDAATEAIAAAFTTPPTTARKDLIDTAVVALKSAGVWTKLDALYAFAAADSQAAKINWKNPGTFNCTEVNAPTFTADSGFTGASTKYLDSGFNPVTAPSPKYVQNSAVAFGWSLTAAATTGGIVGTLSNGLFVVPRDVSTTYYSVNRDGSTGYISHATSDGSGLYAGDRPSSSTFDGYRNGALQATTPSGSLTSTAIANENIIFLRRLTAYFVGQIAAGGFGQSLNSTEQTALYNAIRTYLTGVGVP